MSRFAAVLSWLVLFAVAAGCSAGQRSQEAPSPSSAAPLPAPVDAGREGAAASAPAPSGAALPCDVDQVLGAHCRGCHGSPPSFGAPMSLVTYEDLLAPAPTDPTEPVYEAVEARIHDVASPMPQPPNPALDSQDLGTIDAWVAAGAPAGTACDGGPPAADAGAFSLPCTPDTHIAPASPWTMPAGTSETYVCYGFDANVTMKRHIIAFAPHLDDKTLLHHIVLLESDSSVSPVPAVCPLGGSTAWRPVFGWAPGASSFELPPEAGFPEDSTTHFVVQLHYVDITNEGGLTDQSGFDLCTTDMLRPNDADIMAFGTEDISLPPHAMVNETCDVQVPSWGQPTHVFAAFPHMHELGTSIQTTAYPLAGGAPVTMGAQPHWSFGEQGWIPIDYFLQPGDTVETQCSWDNSTDGVVTFGELSTNEMCFSFTMYYPKITNPEWSWPLPALYSVCN